MKFQSAVFAIFIALTSPVFAQETRGSIININAEGISEASPDMATIRLGVTTTGRTAPLALEQNSQRVTSLMEALRAAGIAERDIQTSALSLHPSRRERVVFGYRAVNAVTVRVRDVQATGRIVDAVVAAGGNTIERISFSFQDPAAQADVARRNALLEARRRADLYAQTLGLRVVRMIEMSEPGAVRSNVEQLELTATLTTDSLLDELPQIIPIAPGEVTTRASVSVSFEIR
ncbi:MAG: SIMPL domain-containing protein [Hyphomonadaceae bacterium]